MSKSWYLNETICLWKYRVSCFNYSYLLKCMSYRGYLQLFFYLTIFLLKINSNSHDDTIIYQVLVSRKYLPNLKYVKDLKL